MTARGARARTSGRRGDGVDLTFQFEECCSGARLPGLDIVTLLRARELAACKTLGGQSLLQIGCARVVASRSKLHTLLINICCVFINCAAKLQYKHQCASPRLHRLIGNYFSGGANLQQ